MAEGTIPEDVRRFILLSIASVPHLEAILMLRAQSRETWSASTVASRLYIPEMRAAEILADLHASGLLERAEGDGATYRYQPAPELAAVIDRTAETYAADLVGVTDLIHSKTGKKAQIFADAFKFRKDS